MIVQSRPYDINWSGNSLYYKLYSAASLADTNTIFEVKIMFARTEELGVYRVLTTLSLTPVNGFVKINLQDIINGELSFDLPEIGTRLSTGKQSGQFYIQFREINAASPNPGFDLTEIDHVRLIVKGGIHIYQFNNNNFWLNYFPGKRPFLTWQKSGRLAAATEPIFLAWYSNFDPVFVPAPGDADNRSIGIRATIYYTDNTNAVNSSFLINNGWPPKNTIYYIPVGATELSILTLNPAKTVWYWTVQVIDTSIPGTEYPLSELFSYLLDNRVDYNDYTLFYRNSLGGLDSVRVRGIIETDIDFELQETEATLLPDYFLNSRLSPVKFMQPTKETISYKGDIGYLGKEEQDRLRDAFLNREVWIQKNGRWWPIEITSKNYKQRSTTDKLFSVPIEWSLADGGSYYYTPGSVSLDTSVDGNNFTPITITINAPDITFNVDDTVATVLQHYIVNLNGGVVDHLQYKIPGFVDDWVNFGNGGNISNQLPANQTFTIYIRAIAAGNIAGRVAIRTFNTNVSNDITFNANLHWNNRDVTATTGFQVLLNGSQIASGIINGDQFAAFLCPAAFHAILVLKFNYIIPSSGKLTMGSTTINGTVDQANNSITFANVDTTAEPNIIFF